MSEVVIHTNKLFQAIAQGSAKMVRKLLSLGIDANSKNSSGDPALFAAIKKLNNDIVKCLLRAGADINIENSRGETAFEVCIQQFFYRITPPGISAIIRLLIDAGSVIHSVEKEAGRTALHAAAYSEDVELTKILLDSGAEVNSRDAKGWTPLHYAARRFDYDLSVIENLVLANAEINAKDKKGQTPLHILVNEVYYVCDSAISKLINFFYNHSAYFDAKDDEGKTPMDCAVSASRIDFIKALIKHGRVDVNCRDKDGWTPLHHAMRCVNSDLSTIRLLLTENANVNAVDNEGQTPLHLLVQSNYNGSFSEIFIILKKYNADFNARCTLNKTPMDIAFDREDLHIDFIKGLIKYGGVDVNCCTTYQAEELSILEIACRKKCLGLVKFLLKNGASKENLDYPEITLFSEKSFKTGESDLDLISFLVSKNPELTTSDRLSIFSIYKFRSYGFLWPAIIEHVAKKNALGLSIHESILNKISKYFEVNELYEDCNEELKKLKNCKISSTRLTLLNLLVDRKEKLCHYIENRKFKENFDPDFLNEKYVIYGSTIQKRYYDALDNQKIVKRCAEILSTSLPCWFHRKDVVIEKIISFCKMKDLRTIFTLESLML